MSRLKHAAREGRGRPSLHRRPAGADRPCPSRSGIFVVGIDSPEMSLLVPERNRREPKQWTRADNLVAFLTTQDEPLFCDGECNVNARIHRVAQVIHAVNLDHKDVLRVEPVAWPRIYKSEPIAPVLEAAIPAVIGLTDTKPVVLSKIGLVTIVGNAATAGMLRRLCGPSLLCVLLFLLTVL